MFEQTMRIVFPSDPYTIILLFASKVADRYLLLLLQEIACEQNNRSNKRYFLCLHCKNMYLTIVLEPLFRHYSTMYFK